MSGYPRWARDAPSFRCTSAWTIDCGCTTTSIRPYGVPKRWWASIISKPLFISVAESMVMRPPMSHVGCASASSGVIPDRSVRPRKGPPDAVRTSRSTVPGRSAFTSWKRAECSESTGMIRVSVASARAVTSSPPTTRLSLFASASSIPSVSATIVGPSPADPTIPFSTRSAPDAAISSRMPSSPVRTRPFHACDAAAAASGSARAIAGTPWSRACSVRRSHWRPAASPMTDSSSEAATTSSACSPMEPVAPRMTSFLIPTQCRGGAFYRLNQDFQALDSNDAPDARLDRPPISGALQERLQCGPPGIGDPRLRCQAREKVEQRAHALALIEQVGGEHDVERTPLHEIVRLRPIDLRGLELHVVQQRIALDELERLGGHIRREHGCSRAGGDGARYREPATELDDSQAIELRAVELARKRGAAAPQHGPVRQHRRPFDVRVIQQLGGLTGLQHAELPPRQIDRLGHGLFVHSSYPRALSPAVTTSSSWAHTSPLPTRLPRRMHSARIACRCSSRIRRAGRSPTSATTLRSCAPHRFRSTSTRRT